MEPVGGGGGGEELTFADYFLVCGLDASSGLEAERYSEAVQEASEARPPLERNYAAKILAHFPHSRPARSFPAEVLSLCMPRGLEFVTQKDLPTTAPTFHTIANIRADGTRLDGAVLTFYERVESEAIRDAMAVAHQLHIRQITAAAEGEERESLLHHHHPPGQTTGGSHTLPRRRPGGSKKGGGSALSRAEERSKRASFYEPAKDALYVTKAICLVTRLPMAAAPEACLRALYQLGMEPRESELPLESYVYWLLHQVPLPPPGGTLKVRMHRADLLCQRPGPGELPFLDVSLRRVFDLVSPETFLRVYTCVMLEHQVLLCSQQTGHLMLVGEALCGLLLPFRWQHAYVPILPYSQATFLELPLPYIMGLAYTGAIPQQVFQSTVCILDIDSGALQMPEDVPSLPDKNQLLVQLRSILQAAEESSNPPPSDPVNGTSQPPSGGLRSTTDARDALKRMSRSFDGDALEALERAAAGHPADPPPPPPPQAPPSRPAQLSVLEESESMQKQARIAQMVGLDISLKSLSAELERSDEFRLSPASKAYFADMRLNNAVRELFFSRMTHLLYSYSDFVIGGVGGEADRDSTANFDKAAFLSDQPEFYLPFLAAFIETQMFTTFVDWRILRGVESEEVEGNLELFDARVHAMRERSGHAMVRTPTRHESPDIAATEELISRREAGLDFVVPPPQPLSALQPLAPSSPSAPAVPGLFPKLRGELLGAVPAGGGGSPWKRRRPGLRHQEQKLSGTMSKAPVAAASAEVTANNWKFVEQLLRETKGKTKRLLVEKMGAEAVPLGHTDLSVTGVEENTLVASLCDLLERIWAHGARNKQGKSALWRHLLAHQQEMDKAAPEGHGRLHPNALLTPESTKQWSSGGQRRGLGPKRCESQGSLADMVEEMEVVEPQPSTSWFPGRRRRQNSGLLRASRTDSDLLGQDDAANGNSGGGGVVAYLQGLQKDLHPDSSGNWGSSLLRAASFISSKIGPATNAPADLAPSWSGSEAGYGGDGGSQSRTGSLTRGESPRKRSLSRPRSPDMRHALRPLPNHIVYDLKNVLRMAEIKTEIGYARAFVRLSLERQLLHQHLKTLIGRSDLLARLYKRYGFLRCEEEREQFLCHVLTLNAARFRCFTNTFTKTRMEYQVLLAPGTARFQFSQGCGSVWIRLAGTLGETPPIRLPAGTLQFSFQHQNLGVLSTLRIGHQEPQDEDGPPPKWLLDHVIARNEVTGTMYKFPCGRWLGRGVDDGAMERLLVAELIDGSPGGQGGEAEAIGSQPSPSSRSATPSGQGGSVTGRSRSPSLRRRSENPKVKIQQLQHELGDAVNAVVKHFYRTQASSTPVSQSERSQLTRLLCGEGGLVTVLERAFMVGCKRSFFRQFYPWDYIEKVGTWFGDLMRGGGQGLATEQRRLIGHMLDLVPSLTRNAQIGKEEKFRTFVLVSLRDKVSLLDLVPSLTRNAQIGKEEKFRTFVLVSLRDKVSLLDLVPSLTRNAQIGKEEKFRTFVLVSLRDKVSLLDLVPSLTRNAQIGKEEKFRTFVLVSLRDKVSLLDLVPSLTRNAQIGKEEKFRTFVLVSLRDKVSLLDLVPSLTRNAQIGREEKFRTFVLVSLRDKVSLLDLVPSLTRNAQIGKEEKFRTFVLVSLRDKVSLLDLVPSLTRNAQIGKEEKFRTFVLVSLRDKVSLLDLVPSLTRNAQIGKEEKFRTFVLVSLRDKVSLLDLVPSLTRNAQIGKEEKFRTFVLVSLRDKVSLLDLVPSLTRNAQIGKEEKFRTFVLVSLRDKVSLLDLVPSLTRNAQIGREEKFRTFVLVSLRDKVSLLDLVPSLTRNAQIGKEEKFRTFVLVSLRDKVSLLDLVPSLTRNAQIGREEKFRTFVLVSLRDKVSLLDLVLSLTRNAQIGREEKFRTFVLVSLRDKVSLLDLVPSLTRNAQIGKEEKFRTFVLVSLRDKVSLLDLVPSLTRNAQIGKEEKFRTFVLVSLRDKVSLLDLVPSLTRNAQIGREEKFRTFVLVSLRDKVSLLDLVPSLTRNAQIGKEEKFRTFVLVSLRDKVSLLDLVPSLTRNAQIGREEKFRTFVLVSLRDKVSLLNLVPSLTRNAQIGKEEKFRTFVLVSLRDKVSLLDLVPSLTRNAQIGKEEKFRTFVLVSLRDKVSLLDLVPSLTRNAQIGREEKFRTFVLVSLRDKVSEIRSLSATSKSVGSFNFLPRKTVELFTPYKS